MPNFRNLMSGDSGAAALVEVENSALFNTTNSEYLSRTLSGAGTSQKTFTVGGWVNRTSFSSATSTRLFQWDNGTTNIDRGFINFDNTVPDAIKLFLEDASDVVTVDYRTTQLFRDIGWFHWCLTVDTTPAAPIFKFFINNAEVTAFTKTTDTLAQNDVFTIADSGARHGWGSAPEGTGYLDAYMAECFYLDGQVVTDATDFVDVDSTGLYITPKSNTEMKALSYGTHGYYLDNTTNAQTDASGNGNNFTNNNTVVTSTHTPTHIETLFNPINTTFTNPASASLSNGNRTFYSAGGYRIGVATLNFPTTGKWWVAVEYATSPAMTGTPSIGITRGAGTSYAADSYLTYQQTDYSYSYIAATIRKGSASGTNVTTGLTALAVGDFMLIAFDADNQTVKWYLEDALIYTLDLSSAPDGYYGNDGGWSFAVSGYVSSGPKPTLVNTANYDYTPPTGYEELNTTNIAASVTRSEELLENHFQVALVNHDGSSTAFTQNWSNATYHTAYWIKNRDAAEEWFVMDTLRGDSKHTKWDDQEPEQTDSNVCTFDGGSTITLGSTLLANNYVVYCFRLGLVADGTSNTDGNVTTVCSANQTAGWSCLNWSGINTNPATIGHGLGGDYGLWMLKVRTVLNGAIGRWFNMGTDKNVYVYGDGAQTSDNYVKSGSDNGATGEGVFGVTGNNTGTSQSGQTYMGMVFAKNTIFLNVGTYEGNGNANGTLVPNINSDGISQQTTFTFSKSIDSSSDWAVVDNVREGYNGANDYLVIDRNIAETATNQIDLVAGGIKNRVSTDPNVAETFSYLTIGIPTIDVDGRIIAGR